MSSQQIIDLTFVTSSAQEADALLAVLRDLAKDAGPLAVSEVFSDSSAGAVSREIIVVAVLTFSLDVAVGVVGNAVYDALVASPSAQCVANETPLSIKDAQDKAQLEAKLRAAARPANP